MIADAPGGAGMSPTLASRRFDSADQLRFADLTGDRNPVHLDEVAARRTLVGAPIVYGMAATIWALEAILGRDATTRDIHSIGATFLKPIYVGETVDLALVQRSEAEIRLHLLVGPLVAQRIKIRLGKAAPSTPAVAQEPVPVPTQPHDLGFADVARARGRLDLRALVERIGGEYPRVAAVLGPERAAAFAATSCLVGMICPGLHSIYNDVELGLVTGWPDAALDFVVTQADERFGKVSLSLAGAGCEGRLSAFVRPKPTAQPSAADVAALVAPSEFAGTIALVIGGSRGLGELVAKIVAAGGGRVVLTYARGRDDAVAVRDDIRSLGGDCDIAPYDFMAPAGPQIDAIGASFDQVYYMATPPIFTKRVAGFDDPAFKLFARCYVSAFAELHAALRERGGTRPSIFYPSSVALDRPVGGLLEYTMAKTAGELLCADFAGARDASPFVVRRLPRLATDQTASVRPHETEDALAVMLPIVRAMRERGRAPPLVDGDAGAP